MIYEEQLVKVASIIAGKYSIRAASKLLGASRNTISTWVSRTKSGLPTRFKRTAKRVWNRTSSEVLRSAKKCMKSGNSVVQTWVKVKKKMSMRTTHRWKAKWFPKAREKKQCKRYVRRKAFSLMHTDWGVKRIKGGKRACISFYVDDATRRMYALRAYEHADQENTNDSLHRARRASGGFKAVLSDCGKVYTKTYGQKCKALGIKSIHTRPYNPKCNGKAEACVKKIKAFLKKHNVRNLNHCNKLLKKYQQQYNNMPHSGIKYLTPLQMFRAKQRSGSVWAVS